MIPKERADELVAEIRARIADRQTTTTHAHPAAEDHAPEVRLRRLADLLNAGLISAEEFEAKRQDVLRDL
jgi:Ribonuclease G/E